MIISLLSTVPDIPDNIVDAIYQLVLRNGPRVTGLPSKTDPFAVLGFGSKI